MFTYYFSSDSEMSNLTPCASSADGSITDSEQPEPDYIKMFVGQIPRAMNEQDLMDMFGEFGRVYQLNLLRDKFTGVSKGKIFTILWCNLYFQNIVKYSNKSTLLSTYIIQMYSNEYFIYILSIFLFQFRIIFTSIFFCPNIYKEYSPLLAFYCRFIRNFLLEFLIYLKYMYFTLPLYSVHI